MTPESVWLPDLAPGWTVGRVGHVADAWTSNVDKHSIEGEPAVRLCNYTDVYKNDAISAHLDFMEATARADQVERFRLRRGDTLITKDSETADDIGIPAFVEYQAPDLLCGYHLAIIRPHPASIAPKYLYWAMASQPTLRQWAILASGVTRVGIRSGDLSKVSIPIPPLAKQQAIADFLDRETAKIDTLIEEQRGLIEMLRERRIALRTCLSTNGIDRSASLKESGVAWARKIPDDWTVVPLTSIAELASGHTPSRSRPELWEDCHIPWISLNDVGSLSGCEYISETTNLISDAGIAASSARVLPAGTVVLSRDATVGRSSIMSIPMATSQHFADWICGPRINPRYLWLLFTSAMQPYFDSLTNGSTLRTIGMGLLKAFRVPLPPLGEQRQIVEEAAKQTAKIDELIAETRRFIDLSKERRTALITAAVTGQIDVREAA